MDPGNFLFAHLADAHVGAWPRDPKVRTALRESVLRALEEVDRRDAAFLLVSGDLFHTPVPEPGEVAPVAAALKRLVDRGRRVYAIYGSHDYVAHRTSWLDVLAETGVFVKVAPEAVRAEGDRFSLPFTVDEGTGARIAGISGRSHGLDRAYFASIDSEAFRAEPGFKIFQFHAAVEEYLPAGLREHIRGIRRQDLPAGCQYYAGGHIHYTYVGEGPEGGLLVNPGPVFGTSVTDLKNGLAGKTHQGIVFVQVRDGVADPPTFVDTAPREALRFVEVDLSGDTAESAHARIAERVEAAAEPGMLIFPELRGVLSDGSLAGLGLSQLSKEMTGLGATIHWDVHDLSSGPTSDAPEGGSETDLERAAVLALTSESAKELPIFAGPMGEERVRALLQELGLGRGEGESKQDYESSRIEGVRRLLPSASAPE